MNCASALCTSVGECPARGIGREHALLFASEGAKVVVNDLGVAPDGSGSDLSVAQAVANEIGVQGSQAVANTESVADWRGAKGIIDTAPETFGDLHIVVNNAGHAHARTLVNTIEEQFDALLAVHLKGAFAVSRWAARYWRDQAKAGRRADRAIVNTSSGAGVHGLPGSAGYAEAKAGVTAMTAVAAMELERYGVRVNCIVPTARTRMGRDDHGHSAFPAPADATGFDAFHPANVSPLVAYLATAGCPFTGQVFAVSGGQVGIYQGWSIA